ncbi:Gfo/Idh/MocA family oxidoreductase [Solwaraspora sp. WMMD1047]|uniref:Gfo/Idh/MocA family protein n=1 Tax=Solwaraspora sp. WMMD1047 TaxID=3016102 RepID=UPI0024179AC2|nr:Gfo/Idh/MocA family oxidoreductase [Solwaraspora sp. WMMD1047]MDG4827797.1 Gfo/Idh/MocA family oxidoreductase [Solwaraspora sp. WMMD1047]
MPLQLHRSEVSPLGLGVLGCAAIATKRVLPAAALTDGIELVAVASRTPAKAEAVRARFGGRVVEGYDQLLEQPDIDVVYVPLPCGLHAEWIERALTAGKHVLAEKPLTTSHEETARLVGLAKANGLVLRENYMFLHHSQHAFVRDLVTAGAIGELRTFSSTFAIPPRPADDIRYRRELGGGALLDVAGYPIRAAQLFLGSEIEVVGAILRPDPAVQVDVGGAVLLRRPDGVTAQLTFGLDHLYTSNYELFGSTGRISVDHVFTPPAGYRPSVRVDQQNYHERRSLEPDDQFVNSLTAFVDAVRTPGGAVSDETIVTQAKLVDQVRRLAGDRD